MVEIITTIIIPTAITIITTNNTLLLKIQYLQLINNFVYKDLRIDIDLKIKIKNSIKSFMKFTNVNKTSTQNCI